jgi:hypothetical protein
VERAQQNSGQAAIEFWLPVFFQHQGFLTVSVANKLSVEKYLKECISLPLKQRNV